MGAKIRKKVGIGKMCIRDRIVGGARPVGEVLKLEAIDPLKAPYFLTRREMGIFNVGEMCIRDSFLGAVADMFNAVAVCPIYLCR